MMTGALAPEDLPAAGSFVERTLTEHPDRRLSIEALIGTLRDVERVEGVGLAGMAVELGGRLARLHGVPAPSFPCEFRADSSEASDRGLALWALWQARQLGALARPQLSREALFLVLGAARLLATDPLILPPFATIGRLVG